MSCLHLYLSIKLNRRNGCLTVKKTKCHWLPRIQSYSYFQLINWKSKLIVVLISSFGWGPQSSLLSRSWGSLQCFSSHWWQSAFWATGVRICRPSLSQCPENDSTVLCRPSWAGSRNQASNHFWLPAVHESQVASLEPMGWPLAFSQLSVYPKCPPHAQLLCFHLSPQGPLAAVSQPTSSCSFLAALQAPVDFCILSCYPWRGWLPPFSRSREAISVKLWRDGCICRSR